MSHAQRNHELRNYESSGEHSITSSQAVRAHRQPGHARSSTVFPARIAGSTTQQSLRFVLSAVAAIVFHHNRTRPSHVDAIEACPPEVRIPANSISPARNSNFGSDPWEILITPLVPACWQFSQNLVFAPKHPVLGRRHFSFSWVVDLTTKW